MKIYEVAQMCHEANRALCQANGDDSQKPWNEAEAWQRDSAVEGVTWRLANLDAPASAQHDQWKDAKLRDGWKFGPVKDGTNKEHPCLVPFDDLPAFQQAKDTLFAAIVKALAPLIE